MKPKIKSKKYYSMILMRDDSLVRTVRLKQKTVTFLLIFFLLLILVGTAGCIGAVYYFDKYRLLQGRYGAQSQEFTAMKLQLEQLSNIKTLATNTNTNTPIPPKNEEVGAHVGGANGTAYGKSAEKDALSGRSNATTPAANGTLSAANATGRAASDAVAQGQAAGEVRVGTPATPDFPLISSEESPVRITGFLPRASGNNRLRLRYELNTVEPRQISGTVTYSALYANGTILPLPLSANSDAATFTMSRGKRMEATIRLPQGFTTRDIEKIQVTLGVENGETFIDTFVFP